jgi:lactoylglutathione lyase
MMILVNSAEESDQEMESTTAAPPTTDQLVTGFWHAGVTVKDMDRALAFYRDTLGLELEWLGDTAGDYRWRVWGMEAEQVKAAFLRVPGSDAMVELFEFVGVERHPASSRPCDYGAGHFCLFVSDAEALYERLVANGYGSRSNGVVTAESGLRRGAKIVYTIDPDGYHVELFQPPAQAQA